MFDLNLIEHALNSGYGTGITPKEYAELCHARAEFTALKKAIDRAPSGILRKSLVPGTMIIDGFDDDCSDYASEHVILMRC